MPAIRPALLRQQAALLAEHYDEPEAYLRSLQHLLEFYAEPARRPGKLNAPPLLQAYHVRPPVLRQVVKEIEPQIKENPQQALALCDALWRQPVYEYRILAILVLGNISTQPVAPLIERLRSWVAQLPEQRILQVLLEDGSRRVRSTQEEEYLKMIQSWMDHGREYFIQVGLQALQTLVKDPDFENLPLVYRLCQPYLLRSTPGLRGVVLDLLSALIERSPKETAFFFRQNLRHPEQRDVGFFIRQTAAHFPADLQESLQQEVRLFR